MRIRLAVRVGQQQQAACQHQTGRFRPAGCFVVWIVHDLNPRAFAAALDLYIPGQRWFHRP
jgi:hypothetical protein